jgi:hypothetical protein
MIWLKARALSILLTVTTIVTVLGAVYGKGRSDARSATLRKAKDKDQKNADSIRDRMRDVPKRVHDYTDRGFRD